MTGAYSQYLKNSSNGDGVPCAERYGAVVPESTCSGIQPYWSSASTVVFHTVVLVPSYRLSTVGRCSFPVAAYNVLEHSARSHSVCAISFCLP